MLINDTQKKHVIDIKAPFVSNTLPCIQPRPKGNEQNKTLIYTSTGGDTTSTHWTGPTVLPKIFSMLSQGLSHCNTPWLSQVVSKLPKGRKFRNTVVY